jgi:hypothetical protein
LEWLFREADRLSAGQHRELSLVAAVARDVADLAVVMTIFRVPRLGEIKGRVDLPLQFAVVAALLPPSARWFASPVLRTRDPATDDVVEAVRSLTTGDGTDTPSRPPGTPN